MVRSGKERARPYEARCSGCHEPGADAVQLVA